MEKKFIVKMIQNCFKQYYEEDSIPIGNQELEQLANRILSIKQEEPATNLYEVVNDIVYEFMID
ncbi:YqzH family protein [Neobacillus sp. OS1-32]|uniref:YqzH family protein n=1 Tax=Neobacillus sp. OS1-32 TaxID=3070682 RepID=UPI0027DFE641|nr:YqzH family protein [Neobacillus sp. OS1-32]WML30789.1 YqzH family protein [Neobacillus sp. OS1-32]